MKNLLSARLTLAILLGASCASSTGDLGTEATSSLVEEGLPARDDATLLAQVDALFAAQKFREAGALVDELEADRGVSQSFLETSEAGIHCLRAAQQLARITEARLKAPGGELFPDSTALRNLLVSVGYCGSDQVRAAAAAWVCPRREDAHEWAACADPEADSHARLCVSLASGPLRKVKDGDRLLSVYGPAVGDICGSTVQAEVAALIERSLQRETIRARVERLKAINRATEVAMGEAQVDSETRAPTSTSREGGGRLGGGYLGARWGMSPTRTKAVLGGRVETERPDFVALSPDGGGEIKCWFFDDQLYRVEYRPGLSDSDAVGVDGIRQLLKEKYGPPTSVPGMQDQLGLPLLVETWSDGETEISFRVTRPTSQLPHTASTAVAVYESTAVRRAKAFHEATQAASQEFRALEEAKDKHRGRL